MLRFENKFSSNGTQALAIIDMELWKSSCDDMHWQQSKCYNYSWQFVNMFNSCRYYDFTSNICWNNMDLACHSLGLFVPPATRGFCVAVKRLNGLEIYSISVHRCHGIFNLFGLYSTAIYWESMVITLSEMICHLLVMWCCQQNSV